MIQRELWTTWKLIYRFQKKIFSQHPSWRWAWAVSVIVSNKYYYWHTLHCINVISIKNRAECLLVVRIISCKVKNVYAASNHSQFRNETQFRKVKIKLWARVTVKRVVCVFELDVFALVTLETDSYHTYKYDTSFLLICCWFVVVVCQSIFNQLIVYVVKVKELWWYVNIIILSFSLKSRTTNQIRLIGNWARIEIAHIKFFQKFLRKWVCSYFLICLVQISSEKRQETIRNPNRGGRQKCSDKINIEIDE